MKRDIETKYKLWILEYLNSSDNDPAIWLQNIYITASSYKSFEDQLRYICSPYSVSISKDIVDLYYAINPQVVGSSTTAQYIIL